MNFIDKENMDNSNGLSSGDSNSDDNGHSNNMNKNLQSPLKDVNVGIKRSLDDSNNDKKSSPGPLGEVRERKQITDRYVPQEIARGTPKRQRSNTYKQEEKEDIKKKKTMSGKLEEKIQEEQAILAKKAKLEELKAKALEKKKASIKFPVEDKKIEEFDTKGKKPLNIPEPTTKICSPFADDIVGVWDFINTFQKQLNLPPIEVDDFIEMMEFTGRESVALTEVFLAPLRIILTDSMYAAKVSSEIPKGISFCRKPNTLAENDIKERFNEKLPNFNIKSLVNKDDGTVDKLVAEGFDSAFNGLRLLPRKLSATLVCDPLKWQTVLRAVILRDPTIKDIRNDIHKLYLEYDNIKTVVKGSRKKSKDESGEGSEEDYQKYLTELQKLANPLDPSRRRGKKNTNVLNYDLFLRLNSDPFMVLENLIAAAQALETKEIHELSFRHKISLLKVLCDACYDTEFIRNLLEENINERANQITQYRKKVEERKKQQREIGNAKREEAVRICWEANRQAAEAKGTKGKKKAAPSVIEKSSPKKGSPKKGSKNKKEIEVKKDAYYPKQDQINAMIEELALLEELKIDKVVENFEVEELDNDDDEIADFEFTDDGPKQKSRAMIRSKAGEKKQAIAKKLDLNLKINIANDAINRALDTRTEKDIKTAISKAITAGFKGTDDDGQTFCTQSLKQIYLLKREIEVKSEEEADQFKQEQAMSGFICRSEPIGKDRNFNEYWAFAGDNRLFVRSKLEVKESKEDKDRLTHQAKHLAEANKHDKSNKLYDLYEHRAFKTTYQWGMFASDLEMWELVQALDERGERESALKAAIKARFTITPPSAEYEKTGSEYIGKSVKRFFKKKLVLGRIVSWLPPNEEDEALWHVIHADGDEEDLEEHEVKQFLVSDEEAARYSSSVMSISAISTKAESKEKQPNKGKTVASSSGNSDQQDIPDIIKRFGAPPTRSHQPVKIQQLGLLGLKADVIHAHNILDALKNTKQWVKSIQDSSSLSEIKGALQELEVMIHDLQEIPDIDDKEVEDREKEEERQKMLKDGYVFDESENEYIGKKVRRFFADGTKIDGIIIAFLEAKKTEEKLDIWRLVHDDGDEEDLYTDDVLNGTRHFNENASFDDTIQDNDDNEDDEDAFQEEIDFNDGDDEVYHPEEVIPKGEERTITLWPTNGVRMRWIESLTKSSTVSEVSLALSSLLEYSKAFGACKDDPLDGVGQRPTTSIYGGHRMISKLNNPKKRKSNYDDNIYAETGRVQRSAARKVINYAE